MDVQKRVMPDVRDKLQAILAAKRAPDRARTAARAAQDRIEAAWSARARLKSGVSLGALMAGEGV